MTNVAVLTPPEARTNILAGGKPTAIVPQSMDDAYRLAKAICMAQMAPKGLDTPEKCMVAIMHGLEVGLTPMAALQRIAVVNGRPTIWGDGAIGLVRASGLCEFVRETLEGAGDAMVAKCEAKRKGEPEPIVRTFSVADAKKAGLWAKQGPWQQFPTRMLAMRARAFALRDGFADVLGGMYLREEIEDTHEAAPVLSPPPAPLLAPPSPPKPSIPEVAKMIEESPQRPADTFDMEEFVSRAVKRMDEATTGDELDAIWEHEIEPRFEQITPPDQDFLQSKMREASTRIGQ